ncbi:MAG: terpene cyclase/mutase family protein [Planctomycetaceae bacterium]|nr:terpene cyclase/mutase family protein [Planctomycetaceae bacterium]
MSRIVVIPALCVALLMPPFDSLSADDELLPKHMTVDCLKATQKGLDHITKLQSPDGSFVSSEDGAAYPVAMTALAGLAYLAGGNTTTRGPHAEQVRKCLSFILGSAGDDGLLAAGQENGRPMYGHGFGLLFLATVYGMETDERTRERIGRAVDKAVDLTASSQSVRGGWYYTPGSGYDEGSVTVTQLQGLRAAHEAGFTVPKGTMEGAVHYLEICRTPDGGIRYSFDSGGDTRLPITAAAICCLYSAGEYESTLADECLEYTYNQFKVGGGQFTSGHDSYLYLYATQAFYQAGDEYWDEYFPSVRDTLVKKQNGDGSWPGNWAGNVYGTCLNCIVLQIPFKYLPIYQR